MHREENWYKAKLSNMDKARNCEDLRLKAKQREKTGY